MGGERRWKEKESWKEREEGNRWEGKWEQARETRWMWGRGDEEGVVKLLYTRSIHSRWGGGEGEGGRGERVVLLLLLLFITQHNQSQHRRRHPLLLFLLHSPHDGPSNNHAHPSLPSAHPHPRTKSQKLSNIVRTHYNKYQCEKFTVLQRSHGRSEENSDWTGVERR